MVVIFLSQGADLSRRVEAIWTNGMRTESHIVHLDLDRRVTVVYHEESSGYFGWADEYIDAYSVAQSCTLKGPDFFSECLADYDDWSHFYDCLDPELWWTKCVDADPWCPCADP